MYSSVSAVRAAFSPVWKRIRLRSSLIHSTALVVAHISALWGKTPAIWSKPSAVRRVRRCPAASRSSQVRGRRAGSSPAACHIALLTHSTWLAMTVWGIPTLLPSYCIRRTEAG